MTKTPEPPKVVRPSSNLAVRTGLRAGDATGAKEGFGREGQGIANSYTGTKEGFGREGQGVANSY